MPACDARGLIEALKRAELTVHDLDYLITHQANQRMVQKVAELAQIDIAKVHKSGEPRQYIGRHAPRGSR